MPSLFQKDCAIPTPLRVVFLGDSVTDNGAFMAYMDAYFARHLPALRPVFINLGVSSETAAGTSEPAHPFPRPCVHDRLDQALERSKPDWVVICYGMNDGIYHPFSEERFDAYRAGIRRTIGHVRDAGAKAIVMTPPPFDAASFDGNLLPDGEDQYAYFAPYVGYDDVLKRYAEWVLALGEEADGAVDIHSPLTAAVNRLRAAQPDYRSGDGIHPNADGHWVIAKTLLSRLFNITLERVPHEVAAEPPAEAAELILQRHRLLSAAWKEHVGHTNPNKADALPLDEAIERSQAIDARLHQLYAGEGATLETTDDWNGYARTDFYLDGRECILIRPAHPAPGNPWIWRAEFLYDFNQADLELLRQGWHIAYCRLSHMYGCPFAVERMRAFKLYLESKYALAPKASLFGFSRGGLYAVNYAAAYPEDVSSLYLDAPVLDIRSWPAGRGDGAGSTAANWEDCMAVYGLTEDMADHFTGNPLDKTAALAAACIPVILVAGDQDLPVPYHENGARLARTYESLGGEIVTIVKPGVGHHPHSLEDPSPIVEFVQRHFSA
ncbi:GDSL-type esterase/lipase family protein [Paenibacillus sp. HJGM_3]|uniref:GDSL-type esterase/lipase family protein n=1 Tax=Paenibacillus sp. HJGM_3 TaxID=3379816 RepID=UPI003858A2F0